MDLTETNMKNERQAFLRARVTAAEDPEVWVPFLGEAALKGLGQKLSQVNDKEGKANVLRTALQSASQGAWGSAVWARNRSMAIAKYKRNLHYALYNESQSPHNILVAHDTIVNWYSNHDFIIGHPFQKDIDYERAKWDFKIGQGAFKVPGGVEADAKNKMKPYVDRMLGLVGGGTN